MESESCEQWKTMHPLPPPGEGMYGKRELRQLKNDVRSLSYIFNGEKEKPWKNES